MRRLSTNNSNNNVTALSHGGAPPAAVVNRVNPLSLLAKGIVAKKGINKNNAEGGASASTFSWGDFTVSLADAGGGRAGGSAFCQSPGLTTEKSFLDTLEVDNSIDDDACCVDVEGNIPENAGETRSSEGVRTPGLNPYVVQDPDATTTVSYANSRRTGRTNRSAVHESELIRVVNHPRKHQRTWTLRFVNDLEENMFRRTRIVQVEDSLLGVSIGWLLHLGELVMWLKFYPNLCWGGASIFIYIAFFLNCVLLLYQFVGLRRLEEYVQPEASMFLLTATMTLCLAGFFAMSIDHVLEPKALMVDILRSYFCLMCLTIIQFSRRIHWAIGVFIVELCVQAQVITEIYRRSEVAPNAIVLEEIFGLISLYVLYSRELNERKAFGMVVSAFGEDLKLDMERERSDALLKSVLPETIAATLKKNSVAFIFERKESCTVLFLDVIGFAEAIRQVEEEDEMDWELCVLLNRLFSAYDDLCRAAGVEKIKSIGNVYLAVAGAPDARPDHAVAAVGVAFQMYHIAEEVLHRWPQLSIRIGINSRPLVGGVLGTKKFAYDIFGETP
jgi:class 3 adenylate cyclase